MNKKEREFNFLVDKHKQIFYSVFRLCGKSNEESEELMIEVLIKLWNDFDIFSEKCNDKSWLWRTAMNICVTHTLRQKAASEIPAGPLALSKKAEIMQMSNLQDRISRLKPFDRSIIQLWLEGKTYNEIGNIMGIAALNVGVRLMKIRLKLRMMD